MQATWPSFPFGCDPTQLPMQFWPHHAMGSLQRLSQYKTVCQPSQHHHWQNYLRSNPIQTMINNISKENPDNRHHSHSNSADPSPRFSGPIATLSITIQQHSNPKPNLHSNNQLRTVIMITLIRPTIMIITVRPVAITTTATIIIAKIPTIQQPSPIYPHVLSFPLQMVPFGARLLCPVLPLKPSNLQHFGPSLGSPSTMFQLHPFSSLNRFQISIMMSITPQPIPIPLSTPTFPCATLAPLNNSFLLALPNGFLTRWHFGSLVNSNPFWFLSVMGFPPYLWPLWLIWWMISLPQSKHWFRPFFLG